MARPLLPVSRLGRNARAALTVICTPPPDAFCFQELRTHLDALAIPILLPGSPFVGPEERRLLSWLAWFQRCLDSVPGDQQDPFHLVVRNCADDLRQTGLRLALRDFIAIGRFADFTGRPVSNDPPPLPTPRTLRQHILDFVKERGIVSSRDLQRFGASRQTVSMMAKAGLLHRVAYSRYSLARGH